jgi:hypothetical protein
MGMFSDMRGGGYERAQRTINIYIKSTVQNSIILLVRNSFLGF